MSLQETGMYLYHGTPKQMVQGPHTHREELTSGMRMLRYMHSGRNHVRTVMHLETGCRPSPRLAQNRGRNQNLHRLREKKRPGQSRRWSHDYKSIVTAPSCTDQGITTHTCTRCGNSYIDAYVEALGHDWKLTETREPTETEGGYRLYTCERCNQTRRETIPCPRPSAHRPGASEESICGCGRGAVLL